MKTTGYDPFWKKDKNDRLYAFMIHSKYILQKANRLLPKKRVDFARSMAFID